jgi:hypothetical protein
VRVPCVRVARIIAMMKRDLFVLVVFVIAIFEAFEDKPASSGASFIKLWEIQNHVSTKEQKREFKARFVRQSVFMPPPVIVFDLNGDGAQETIVCTGMASVDVFDASSRSRFIEQKRERRNRLGFTEYFEKKKTDDDDDIDMDNNYRLRKIATVSLRANTKTRMKGNEGRNAIAIAAGRPSARRVGRRTSLGNSSSSSSSSSSSDRDRDIMNRKEEFSTKRKAIFVVVTESLQVIAFDHNCKKKWERSVQDELFLGKKSSRVEDRDRVSEIAITVVSAAKSEEDGLVVVGGRVERLDENELDDDSFEDDDYEGDAKAFERELRDEEMLQMHRGGRRDKSIAFQEDEDGIESVSEIEEGDAKNKGQFVYLAFNAKSGELIWRRVASDFVADPVQLLRRTVPSHEVRLDSHLTAIEDEKSKTDGICRSYRESALAEALPHAWRDAEDTKMHSAPFSKSQKVIPSSATKSGRKHRNSLGIVDSVHAKSATNNLKSARDPNFSVADKTNDFSAILARGFSYLSLGKSAVHHLDDEIEKLDYHNRRYHHQHLSSNSNIIKNAIIAHHREGVEVLDAFTGELICQLALEIPGYHADINGDGAIDHLDARGHRARFADTALDGFAPGCWATVTSGAPDVETVFEGSICKPTRKMKSTPRQLKNSKKKQRENINSDFHLRNKYKDDVDVLTPIIVRRDDKSERNRSFRRATKDAIFLNSRGELTCYTKDGARRWMVNTHASWKIDSNGPPKDGIYDLVNKRRRGEKKDDEDEEEDDLFVPTLATFKFRTHHRHHGVSHEMKETNRTKSPSSSSSSSSQFASKRSLTIIKKRTRVHTSEAALIVGSKRAVVVSPSGKKIATIFLPSLPIARAQVIDCNDDGKNDFIVRMELSTICYAQKNASAVSVYACALCTLLLSAFIAFINNGIDFEKKTNTVVPTTTAEEEDDDDLTKKKMSKTLIKFSRSARSTDTQSKVD